MRELDLKTIQSGAIAGRELMARAARTVLEKIQDYWPCRRRLLIFCGPGNNGGDGLALALFAHQAGMAATVCLVDPRGEDVYPAGSDPQHFLRLAHSSGVDFDHQGASLLLNRFAASSDELVVVDALFGTGLDRELQEPYRSLVECLNGTLAGMGIPLVAVDLPSGLNADTGLALGSATHAALTVSFGYPKLGFYHPAAAEYLGEIAIEDIGLDHVNPVSGADSAFDLADELPLAALKRRRQNTQKGDYGKLLIIAGHRRYPGAPRLAAEGAARMGAGLVRLVVPDSVYEVCCSNPGIMVDGHPEDGFGGFASEPSSALLEYLDWADSVVIGPGFGAGEAGVLLVRKLLASAKQPVVLDADALRALPCPHVSECLLLTPHAGELARLLGIGVDELMPQWFEFTRAGSQRLKAYVLAKSNQCALASTDGSLRFPRRGHPVMAVGGSGDVLAGMLGTLLAQRRDYDSPEQAICAGVNMHSAAARLYASRRGETGMSPLDLARWVPRALEEARDRLWQNPL